MVGSTRPVGMTTGTTRLVGTTGTPRSVGATGTHRPVGATGTLRSVGATAATRLVDVAEPTWPVGAAVAPGTATGGVTALIALAEADLGRHVAYVAHRPTRRRLTGRGLSADGALTTCAALDRDGLRTVTDPTVGADPIPAKLRERLMAGRLRGSGGPETESLLLGGARPVTTASSLPSGPGVTTADRPCVTTADRPCGPGRTNGTTANRPDLLGSTAARRRAPSLDALVRFAAVTEELAALRGRFVACASRRGPGAVAEAARRLLAVFEEGADGEVPRYGRAAALLRPLALTAGPGAGLALDLPARTLENEFGAGRVARFEDVDFPAALAHEPTRRFLRETGLPEDRALFQLDTDVPLPTLAEYYAEEDADRPGDCASRELPARADRLIRLGCLVEDGALVVDGTTGEVWHWSEADTALDPLNKDVSTLAFTLWLLHREKRITTALGAEPTTEAYDRLAATMTQTLATLRR
ncbi:SUKH-4 family immunity protein [Streptomyces sp. NPDC046985]|uniref:SUKH-4 family immunity protein n=1 Tax=Streptomyces sp. NPDC046985 TaxID=3155377 RepID=UPI00340F482B